MKEFSKVIKYSLSIVFLLGSYSCAEKATKEVSLKEAIGTKFYIGTALNTSQILEKDTAGVKVITSHFNSVVAENCMKQEIIHPVEGEYDFTLADKFVDFGEANDMFIIGHTLIWHSQAAPWFFVDSLGNDISKEVLIDRMKSHITTVVGRYKGRVNGWDVVNEAILDDGNWRETKFYKIIGPEYIQMAFEFAHEADPEAELYYNDYSMANEGRCKGVVNMIKNLQENGVRVDGVGMQGHCGIDFPAIVDFENSLLAFSKLGVKVMITELDITVLPFPDSNVGAEVSTSFEYTEKMNPYANGLPDSVAKTLENRYMDFFKLFFKHHDKISRVTVWGVNDAQSWRNYWPIEGRTDYPLLFDRENQAKPIVYSIINEAIVNK